MRVLLDECLPTRLKQVITGHEVSTVSDAGWAGKGNGELLGLAVDSFDVFVTIDKNLPAQQNLQRLCTAPGSLDTSLSYAASARASSRRA